MYLLIGFNLWGGVIQVLFLSFLYVILLKSPERQSNLWLSGSVTFVIFLSWLLKLSLHSSTPKKNWGKKESARAHNYHANLNIEIIAAGLVGSSLWIREINNFVSMAQYTDDTNSIICTSPQTRGRDASTSKGFFPWIDFLLRKLIIPLAYQRVDINGRKSNKSTIAQGFHSLYSSKLNLETMLTLSLVPLSQPVKIEVSNIWGFTIGTKNVIRWILREFSWQWPPVQTGLPVSLFENLQYLLHHHLACFRWQMNSIPAGWNRIS